MNSIIIIYFFIHLFKCHGDYYDGGIEFEKMKWRLASEMPRVGRNIILLKEDCGEVCDTSEIFVKSPGKYFDVIKKSFECDILLTSPSIVPDLVLEEQMPKRKPPLIYEIPKEIAELYTFERRVQMYNSYKDDSNWINQPKNPNWNTKSINDMVSQIKRGNLKGGYGIKTSHEMIDILEKYMIENIEGKHVLVIGSTSPWVEAILIYLGAKKITTLEYADQKNEHPQINLVTPESLRKLVLEGNAPEFDAMVTFSSLEHSGLGRYGDTLNPWGDLITMAQSWCLLKAGARALVGIPGGKDAVQFNMQRTYGRIILPHLFANWEQIYTTYKDFPAEGFSAKNPEEFCEKEKIDDLGELALMHCFQPMTVLEKPML